MDDGPTSAPTRPTSTRPALDRLLRSSAQYAHIRIQMMELELGAERDRLWAMMVTTLVLALAGLTSVNFLAALIIALAWETPWRLHAIAAMAVAALLTVAGAWAVLRKLRREATRPLAGLMKDLQSFGEPVSKKRESHE